MKDRPRKITCKKEEGGRVRLAGAYLDGGKAPLGLDLYLPYRKRLAASCDTEVHRD